jgi:hypothetical protein
MALQRAKRTGGGFLDLKELAADGPVLAVFRVCEFQAPEKNDFGGYNLPVIADVLICSGSTAGQVHLGERLIGAITATLRGVPNPKAGEQPSAPVTEVGAEIVGRIKVVVRGKNPPFAGIDEPSDAEMAAVEQVYDGGAAWAAGTSVASTPEPAMAGAGGGKSRPW